MQVNRIQDNNTDFSANVSKHFSQVIQNYYNYNNYPNKLKRMYEFNQKIEQYSKFGHDDYTIDYEKKLKNGNWQHYLIAQKNDENKKIVLFNRDTLVKILNRFMQMNKHEFNTKFAKK